MRKVFNLEKHHAKTKQAEAIAKSFAPKTPQASKQIFDALCGGLCTSTPGNSSKKAQQYAAVLEKASASAGLSKKEIEALKNMAAMFDAIAHSNEATALIESKYLQHFSGSLTEKDLDGYAHFYKAKQSAA